MDRTPAHVADMLEFARELIALAGSKPLPLFLADRVLCLAVEKLFINLGEAAKRIDPAETGRIPGVPWVRVIGLRNILAHGYEQIEHEVLYKAIVNDLPALAAALEQWLAGHGA
ncbi:HepT-like ribonuclease domain-containing protein [Variovorax terrae]|uniref:DUF86 domain-containing protein n=1 Tax=Variovorax terrae TaxID=2923278 RepID=A0A9X1VYL2_9BURK|nr:DUF86 domain-containing protein [Variovorax terrae]MCJ0765658.1 DUF86 domain-containing protein [Variovorax terrae]